MDKDGNLATGSSGMEERLYSLNDANFNTTALVTSGGVVSERFLFDPYGQVTAANGTLATPSADNAWIYLHQGGRWDSATGMYNFRNRDFSPTLMRWTTNDPIGFGGGDTNTYRYVGNGPGNQVDPSGLQGAGFIDTAWYALWNPWQTTKIIVGDMTGNLYNGGKALVTGEAGEALGQRAVDLVESQTGKPFTGTPEQWSDIRYHFVGELSGM